ncbi:hypothetical protein TNCV_1548621 [Trichonephila clavipes]|nr:hypothetical protein TNCV_1548621 [Trichonephila clavipes]
MEPDRLVPRAAGGERSEELGGEGSLRIKVVFEPWRFRRSNCTLDIEPASSPNTRCGITESELRSVDPSGTSHEANTRHRVSLVSAHVTTLEEDLKQQPLCQDSPKDVLSRFRSGDRAGHSIRSKP